MTEPPQQPPYPPPSPFNPPGVNPGVPGRPPGRSGCSKPLLIGCGAVLLLLGIGLIVMILNAPKLVQWSFRALEQEVMKRLGPDVTPEDRARLAAAFQDANQAMEKNEGMDFIKIQAFQNKVMEVTSSGRSFSRKDVQELIRLLEELAGKEPSPDPSAQRPSPRPSPTRTHARPDQGAATQRLEQKELGGSPSPGRA